MRAALFITCFNDTLFPGTGRAVVELLERLGHDPMPAFERKLTGVRDVVNNLRIQAAAR